MNEKWEYKIYEFESKSFGDSGDYILFEQQMNELGEEGWEFVCFKHSTSAVFKRRKN